MTRRQRAFRAGGTRQSLRAALVLLLTALAAPASAQEQPAWLKMAIAAERADPEALRKAAGDDPDQQKLAAATELSWQRRDAEAAAALRVSADTLTSKPLRADALNMLTAVHLRAGNYALAAAARAESRKLIPPSTSARFDLLSMAEALKNTPPMTMSGASRGMFPLNLDMHGLPRANVSINGRNQLAVFDTGASISAVSKSVAKRAGIRALDSSVRFKAGGNRAVNAAIGVANELVIGETRFHNVVVLIVPDDDMNILGGETKIDAVVGLAVFIKMGSIAMLPDKGGLTFAYRPSGLAPGPSSNMRMHKLTLIVTGTLMRPEPAPISMLLDTGSNATSFNSRFVASFPELAADAPLVSTTRRVIGEASVQAQARRLGEIRLEFGATKAGLTGAHAHEDTTPSYDGALGQDLLRVGFIADFDAMTFELAPQGEASPMTAPASACRSGIPHSQL